MFGKSVIILARVYFLGLFSYLGRVLGLKTHNRVQVGLKMEGEGGETVVMTGGSFNSDKTVVTKQPNMSRSDSKVQSRPSIARAPFDDTLSERDWNSNLCQCEGGNTNRCSLCCCWCVHKYILATRLGETPFMGLIPCASFALRIKVRTLFGIKGSLIKDFLASLFCEPCTICQMSRELDHVGL